MVSSASNDPARPVQSTRERGLVATPGRLFGLCTCPFFHEEGLKQSYAKFEMSSQTTKLQCQGSESRPSFLLCYLIRPFLIEIESVVRSGIKKPSRARTNNNPRDITMQEQLCTFEEKIRNVAMAQKRIQNHKTRTKVLLVVGTIGFEFTMQKVSVIFSCHRPADIDKLESSQAVLAAVVARLKVEGRLGRNLLLA